MRNAVLMVAFHFPPAALGSGHLRTLGFARHLPTEGWTPMVLSACPMAYPATRPVGPDDIPAGCSVHRALAFDASRHLAIHGKYPGFIAQPDRWSSWWPAAVISGLRLIRRHRIKAVWSTYPIMTAHCIARTLGRVAGIPWIADFRDPVATSVEAGNRWSFASQHRWEQRTLRDAARIVFTTPSALRACAERYPQAHTEGRLALIENGYDDFAFTHLPAPAPSAGRPLVFVHSGLLYTDGRNPTPFFTALARLRESGTLSPADVRIVLRASGSEAEYAPELERLRIADLVTLAPPVSNRAALEEQARADALILFQGARFDRQIPAKLYEYLRIGRPILALVSETGDTARLLQRTGGAKPILIDDADAITSQLLEFVDALRRGNQATVPLADVTRYSRASGTRTLAQLLGQVIQPEHDG